MSARGGTDAADLPVRRGDEMFENGDRVTLDRRNLGETRRGGVVVAVAGRVLTIQWDNGSRTQFVAAAGSLTVVEPEVRRESDPP
ncbi:MAG: hypothetical protein JWM12_733 [Ilumatobacteraceae bacterium]|nr:hypothetical protein [Ilumatobacteraceae bacterium]